MAGGKKRTGRPVKRPSPGQRVSLGLKVTAELKNQIDEAAQRSGRTQSQEAEARLERTFRDQQLLYETLELAFGPKLGGLLFLLGKSVAEFGPMWAFRKAGQPYPDGDWVDEPYAFEQVENAFKIISTAVKPVGDASPPAPAHISPNWSAGDVPKEISAAMDSHIEESRVRPGETMAKQVLRELAEPPRNLAAQGAKWRVPVRQMLGPKILARIDAYPEDDAADKKRTKK